MSAGFSVLPAFGVCRRIYHQQALVLGAILGCAIFVEVSFLEILEILQQWESRKDMLQVDPVDKYA